MYKSVIQPPEVLPVNVNPLNSIDGTLPPVFQDKSNSVPFNVPPVTKVLKSAPQYYTVLTLPSSCAYI